jgi:hypothetical protein
MKQAGKSWTPNVEGDYAAGSYYLRYREGDKRKWEGVGKNLTFALTTMKERQAMITNASLTPTSVPDVRVTMESAISSYLSRVRTVNGTKSCNRMEKLFAEFQAIAKKTYLDEITHNTLSQNEPRSSVSTRTNSGEHLLLGITFSEVFLSPSSRNGWAIQMWRRRCVTSARWRFAKDRPGSW